MTTPTPADEAAAKRWFGGSDWWSTADADDLAQFNAEYLAPERAAAAKVIDNLKAELNEWEQLQGRLCGDEEDSGFEEFIGRLQADLAAAANRIAELEAWKAVEQRALIHFASLVAGVVPGDGLIDTTKNLLAENQRLTAIVERLPKTADGMPVIPGLTELYVPLTGKLKGLWSNATVAPDVTCFRTDEGEWQVSLCGRRVSVSDCYSTRQLAEAAKEETDAG